MMMPLCLVTDRCRLSPDARTPRDQVLALAVWLEEAVTAGVDLVCIRERDVSARLLGELLRAVRSCAQGSRTRVVASDRVDVAVAEGVDGVHLRGDGPPVARARSLGPSGWLVGRSVHGMGEARLHADADYLFFGSVFPSGPKPGRGLAALQTVVAASSAPVLAVGGITAERARQCLAAGASGVAAIGLFLPPGRTARALGITAAAQALRAAIDHASRGHLQ